MRVPKYIRELLVQRRKAAEKINACDTLLSKWMEKQGMSIISPEIVDSIMTGAVEICEPSTAEQVVLEYIEKFEKECD